MASPPATRSRRPSRPTAELLGTALPFSNYSAMLVDPVHQHLFVTGGSGSSSILVTNYSGGTVAAIPNEPGASGLALSDDGSTVYVALAGGNAISAISTSTLAETALPDVTTAADGSFTIADTPPKMHANQDIVTYQFSYAGDPHLAASTATFSVSVQPGNGNS